MIVRVKTSQKNSVKGAAALVPCGINSLLKWVKTYGRGKEQEDGWNWDQPVVAMPVTLSGRLMRSTKIFLICDSTKK